MKKEFSSQNVIKTSLVVDISDILLNTFVAIITGSSIMLAEALQGLSDLITVIFLYVGIKRSAKSANKKFNFGYGRELYFWVLCSAIAMLIITAGLSFYSGLQKLINPIPLERTFWAYLILIIGMISNFYAFSVSYRKITKQSAKASIIKSFASSHLIEIKTAFITDLMGTLSALFGFISMILYSVTGNPKYDGLGAIIVGVMIATFAIIIIIESKEMIIGKSISKDKRQKIIGITSSHPNVKKILQLSTMHFGSDELYVNMNIKVDNNLETRQIEKVIDEIEKNIKDKIPEIDIIQIEIDSLDV
jgi:cation diffusion facilitator family transporter